MPSPGVRVAVAESLIRDLGRVSEWCDLWWIKLNASKTKTMIVSRSLTPHPQSPPSTIGGTVLKESDDLVILGVTFDLKMTFEKHLRSVSSAASQRLGILRKSWQVFHDISFLGRCFQGLVLPVLQYCSAVWCSAADTHLKLLDRSVSGARFLTGFVFEYDISHRLSVVVLCMLYKIRCNPVHPLNGGAIGPLAHTWTVCASAGYTRCSGRTSVHLCTALLQDLALQQDHYSLLGVPLERSCQPRIRWCGLAGLKSRANASLLA